VLPLRNANDLSRQGYRPWRALESAVRWARGRVCEGGANQTVGANRFRTISARSALPVIQRHCVEAGEDEALEVIDHGFGLGQRVGDGR